MRPEDWRAGLRWLPVSAYFVATSLGHLEFSLWLVRSRDNAWLGRYAFKDAVPVAVVLGGLALTWWVLRSIRRDPRGRARQMSFWLCWLLCVVLVDRFLTYSVNEYAHYPQYALLSWLLAWALDPDRRRRCAGRVLFWTTLLGMVDETMQYLWITPSYGNYLDFNDFFVNLLAGAAGVALYYRGQIARAGPGSIAPREALVASCLAAGVALGMASGVLHVSPGAAQSIPPGGWMAAADGSARLYLQRAPSWYGSWQPGTRHAVFWVLSPWMGSLLMGAAAALFAIATAPPRGQPAQGWGEGAPYSGGAP